MNLLGIQVERKTDILALAAFLLSVAGIISQLTIFVVVIFRGAVVTLFPSEQVLLKADVLEKDGTKYVRIGARMAYTNSGAAGYNAVIEREIVTMDFGSGVAFQQKWQTLETFDIVEQKLTSIERKPANPLPINAGSAESHDTYFVPFRKRCGQGEEECDEWQNYLSWSKFLEKIENTKQMKFEFTGNLYGEHPAKTSCIVRIDSNLIDRLRKNEWYSASCWRQDGVNQR